LHQKLAGRSFLECGFACRLCAAQDLGRSPFSRQSAAAAVERDGLQLGYPLPARANLGSECCRQCRIIWHIDCFRSAWSTMTDSEPEREATEGHWEACSLVRQGAVIVTLSLAHVDVPLRFAPIPLGAKAH
jgi:hypothetical protein